MFIRLDYPEDELWLLELQIQRKVPHNEFLVPVYVQTVQNNR